MVKQLAAGTALAAAVVVWAAAAQDAPTVVANASKAIGVDTLKTVQYSATGFDFALGQAYNPSSPWPRCRATPNWHSEGPSDTGSRNISGSRAT